MDLGAQAVVHLPSDSRETRIQTSAVMEESNGWTGSRMSGRTVGPAEASTAPRGRVPMWRSLMFHVPLMLAGSVLGMVALTVALMMTVASPRLREQAEREVTSTTASIGEELNRRVDIARTLCAMLARMGEALPQDPAEHMRVIPKLIDGVGDGWFIAGGGIWPEPCVFEQGVERRSFFWGREPTGELKYFDDYNDPAGPGYHHEEWYVPVRFVSPEHVYWSRSYIDPYSQEPMVTCSAPMYRDGRYYGVVTVDVKLSGLNEVFRKATREIGGYAFAVDREGVFLSYPDEKLIRTSRTDAQGQVNESFLSADEFGRQHASFASIASGLGTIDSVAIARAEKSDRFSADIIRRVEEDSYQINEAQAQLIVSVIANSEDPMITRQLDAADDPLLGEPCIVTVRAMAETGWKIVTVMPESRAFAGAQSLYWLLMLSLVGVLVVGFGATLLLFYRSIVRPLTMMTRELYKASVVQHSQALQLPASRRDELGLLASTFNEYSRSLATALGGIEHSRAELEARVTERTGELLATNAALELSRASADDASRAKSDFLANMSHEIRTPLTAILGFADLLRDDGEISKAPPRRVQHISTIRQAGQHLLTVINDILDLSKIEAEKMSIESIETQVVRVVAEVESLVRPCAVGKGVSFNAVLATPVPDRVMTDPTRLRQILMNLVGNAAKFRQCGSITVTVRVERRPDVDETPGQQRLIIDVEDTGPGMTCEESKRLFAAFSQADTTVTRRHGGTGLGLTISRRLARLMDGDVTLLWTEVGRGSSFRVDLPLVPVSDATDVSSFDAINAETVPASALTTPILTGRILRAEDGLDNQRFVAFHLTKAGAEVDIADNGRIALNMIDAAESAGRPYDLLLSDMQMPDIDGYTLARILRQRGSTLPIVALTAHAMAEDRAKCISAGCDDYTRKPIEKIALLATCAAWIGRAAGADRPRAAA